MFSFSPLFLHGENTRGGAYFELDSFSILHLSCCKFATLRFYHKIYVLSIIKTEKIDACGKDFVFYRDFVIKVLTKLKKLDIIIGQITKPRSVLYGEVLKW